MKGFSLGAEVADQEAFGSVVGSCDGESLFTGAIPEQFDAVKVGF